MPRLSIIIPFEGNAEQLENTLVSVLQNRPDDCEVLVVHSGNYDDPYDLCDEVRFVEVPEAASLGGSIHAALGAARGEILHVLHAGAEVDKGWTQTVLDRFDDPSLAAVSPLVMHAEDRSQMLTAGVGYLSYGQPLSHVYSSIQEAGDRGDAIVGPSLLAGFYRRSAVELAGGLDRAVGDELADVDLGLTIRAMGYRTELATDCHVYGTASPRFGADRFVPKSFRQALYAERLFRRYARWRHLFRHAGLVAAEFAEMLHRPSAVSKLLGRLAAWCDGKDCRDSRRRMYAVLHEKKSAKPAVSGPVRIDDRHPVHERSTLSAENSLEPLNVS